LGGEIFSLTLSQLSKAIREGKTSPIECVQSFLERIDKINPRLNAYITITGKEAAREAEERERELKKGVVRGPLHGIPVSVKDNIMTKGVATTSGSKLLAEWIPDYDAVVVERLKTSGAIILGKTNLDEWAKTSSGINPYFGIIRNPWDMDRIPGGSSGGSAAAVAASLCPASIGNDAAGSVRNPASLCGVVGLKPTYGRIPCYGTVKVGGTLATQGLLTQNSEDAALLLEVLAGSDPRDRSTLGTPSLGRIDLNGSLEGMRLGVVREYFFDTVSTEVRQSVERAVEVLEGLGMQVDEVFIPHLRYAPIIWAPIARVEGWAGHEDNIRKRPNDYGRAILTRLLLGKFIDGSQYLKAQRARALLIKEFDDVLSHVDCLATATTPIVAPRIDEYKSGYLDVDGKKVEVGMIYSFMARCTLPFNLTGHPAVSTPCGFSSSGLPIGLQIIGKAFDEARILRIAYHYEKATRFIERKPLF